MSDFKSGRMKSENLMTNKCMNIISNITNKTHLMQKYASDFERVLMPIFEFMVDPSQINIEDNILTVLKNFIKKTQSVSDIIFKVLPCMENVFRKNKLCFGDALLETLNYYLIFGKDRFI